MEGGREGGREGEKQKQREREGKGEGRREREGGREGEKDFLFSFSSRVIFCPNQAYQLNFQSMDYTFPPTHLLTPTSILIL